MGKSIYMPHGAEDTQAMNARVERIEQLYRQDGRHNPDHPWHAHYTGLAEKYGNTKANS